MKQMREGGNLLSKVHQVSGRVFARVLKEYGIHEINPAQGRILYVLWQESPLNQTELARRTKLDKSTLALMLQRLEEQGQIERIRDREDSRCVMVSVTKKNQTMHRDFTRASEEMTNLYYRDITETDIDQFEDTLRKILVNLERE